MASPPKLKVFRTSIGFHDAYVAAPSQKAALKAWGSDSDLFARKSAERVTDPVLIAEPLANPGKIIKRLRGTAAEQIAALGPTVTQRRKKSVLQPGQDELPAPRRKTSNDKQPPKSKPKPRPDHSAVASAEGALAYATQRQAIEQKDLRDRQAALDLERREMERRHRSETETLEETRLRAEALYNKAMTNWRG
jgi:hypothetical protein